MIWLFSDIPEDSENHTVVEHHSSEAPYSAAKKSIYAIQTKDEQAQQDVVHRMINITQPCTIM